MQNRLTRGMIALVVSIGTLSGQEEIAPPTARAAILTGAKVLTKLQERYTRDRRVRRIADDALRGWQERERARLAALRASGGLGVEWPYEGVYRVGGIVPPGYRVGGTAIACSALVNTPLFETTKSQREAVQRGMQFMLAELESNELLSSGPKRGYDVRGWAHTYALDFFLLAERRKLVGESEIERVHEMIDHLIACLAANETSGGGWNYANDSLSPFMTGSTLLALYRARAQGYGVDTQLVERALDGLEKARATTGAYVYSGVLRAAGRSDGRRARRSSKRTAMPGACARAAIAELSLFLAGRSDTTKLRVTVDAFFEHWDELEKRKSKQGTHEGPYGIAPYYFMYGHVYAALAIESLPEKARPALREKMQSTLWKTRESDGGWNDRIFPRSKSYSTAMAMLALLAPQLEPLPLWKKD